MSWKTNTAFAHWNSALITSKFTHFHCSSGIENHYHHVVLEIVLCIPMHYFASKAMLYSPSSTMFTQRCIQTIIQQLRSLILSWACCICWWWYWMTLYDTQHDSLTHDHGSATVMWFRITKKRGNFLGTLLRDPPPFHGGLIFLRLAWVAWRTHQLSDSAAANNYFTRAASSQPSSSSSYSFMGLHWPCTGLQYIKMSIWNPVFCTSMKHCYSASVLTLLAHFPPTVSLFE